MIRAADDFDAIHAAVQQLRNDPVVGVVTEVDVQWYYNPPGNFYGYKALSERAKASLLRNYDKDDQDFVKFGTDPPQVKKILQLDDLLFEEVPAP